MRSRVYLRDYTNFLRKTKILQIPFTSQQAQISQKKWNNLYGLMAWEISSHILNWNTECLNFNLWQLGQMWPKTPQKWQTRTNLGTSVFLIANIVSSFGFFLNKEQFGLIWPTTPQRWQVGTKTYFFCTLAVGLDIGLETSVSTSELLLLSNLAYSSWKEGYKLFLF